MEKDLVEFIVKPLVENPDAMSVTEIDSGDERILELRVAPEDVGKVIGRHGRIVKAIRTLLQAADSKNEHQGPRTVLEVIDQPV